MTTFWILATCECGAFPSAHMDFCLYRIGGDIFVNHEGCGPQFTSYSECRCLRAEADWGTQPEAPRDDRTIESGARWRPHLTETARGSSMSM